MITPDCVKCRECAARVGEGCFYGDRKQTHRKRRQDAYALSHVEEILSRDPTREFVDAEMGPFFYRLNREMIDKIKSQKPVRVVKSREKSWLDSYWRTYKADMQKDRTKNHN